MIDSLTFRPIGVVHSPFTREERTPIQPATAAGTEGTIEIETAYAPALADLDGFERIWVLYVFHCASAYRPLVVPYLDDRTRGLFATRAPCRPNPIGMSPLRLLAIIGATLRVADLDILDGTPVLDIKPYVPRFDAFPSARGGGLDAAGREAGHADSREGA